MSRYKYKAVLVVSISNKKVREIERNDDERRKKAREMAKHLIGEPGVTRVEPVVFNAMLVDPDDQTFFKDHWKPVGAVVTVEAEDGGTLEKYVRGVHKAASAIDQNTMWLLGVNGWGMTD